VGGVSFLSSTSEAVAMVTIKPSDST
jgi:hypothetical protein